MLQKSTRSIAANVSKEYSKQNHSKSLILNKFRSMASEIIPDALLPRAAHEAND
jgi:hypothetical protein